MLPFLFLVPSKSFMKYAIALLLCCLHFSGFSQTVVELHDGWQFREQGTTTWLQAQVPGCVHEDLLRLNKIPDPFYRTNEDSVQWIEKRNWEYKTSFHASDELLRHDYLELQFEGLDTYAAIFLNDNLVLRTNNMFRTWEIPVKSMVKRGENKLQVVFTAPLQENIPKFEANTKRGFELPAGNDAADQKVSVFTRKAPFHFGWDWGPRLVTSGIWRSVSLTGWRKATIKDLHVIQVELTPQKAKLVANLEIETTQKSAINLHIKVAELDTSFTQNLLLNPGLNKVSLSFDINGPKLWWTNGLGQQYLYNIEASLSTGEEVFSSKTTRIGLRTIELVQEKDKTGTSYYFKLNGVPVFMKGANYIPQDHLLTRISSTQKRKLLEAATEANMNMIRVWGGGIYESNEFYDFCDELGLLVWQDFMFACSMYPNDPHFHENVKQEAIDNVKRLRNHASLALLCGNNEVEVAWNNWGWQNQHNIHDQDSIDLWHGYQHLFEKMLPEIVAEYSPLTPFVSTSPLSNWGTPENFNHSSMHYWGVWHGEDPFEGYAENVGRFNAEFGFQSFPEMKTIKAFSEEEDRNRESAVMKAHQKSYKGNRLLKIHMDELFREPKDFESFIHLNQLVQAKGLKIAFESHRMRMPHSMGSLYWQLNDCWSGPSWSGIDYFGRWKALHYQAKRSFSKYLVIPKLNGKKLDITVVSDDLEAQNLTIEVEVNSFKGGSKKEESHQLKASPNSSKVYHSLKLKSLTKGIPKSQTAIWVKLKKGGKVVSEQKLFFIEPKVMNLPLPAISRRTLPSEGGLQIELTANHLAKGVYLYLENDDGHFSDNFFDMMPGESRVIEFTSDKPLLHLDQLLQIKTVRDTY